MTVTIQRCLSVKNKKEINLQCPHTAVDKNLCGVHLRSKKVNYYQEIARAFRKSHIEEGTQLSKSSRSSTPLPTHQIPLEPETPPEPEYYDQLEYFETRKTDDFQYDILIKTLKQLKIQIDGTKPNLIEKIKTELDNQMKIQEAYQDLSKCNNQHDFYDFTELDEIPKEYLFIFMCGDNRIYGMDLRSLYSYFQDKERALHCYGRSIEYTNPYNRQHFSSQTLCQYRERIEELKEQEKPLTYPQDTPSAEQDINFKTVELFTEISNYGYIVDPDWFLNLDLENLKKLYVIMDDIWNRRLGIPVSVKRNIVPDDTHIFSLSEFFQIRDFNLQRLQYLLINKFTSLVTKGTDRENRIMGINYILMGLSEICDIDTVMSF